MSCGTHALRDQIDLGHGEKLVLAEKPEFQCQCMFGIQCARRATDEDFRCDWCRAIEGNCSPKNVSYRGHEEWVLKQQRMNYTARPSQFGGLYAAEPMPFAPPRFAEMYESETFRRVMDEPLINSPQFTYRDIEQRIGQLQSAEAGQGL